MNSKANNNFQPVLLSNAETHWLLGDINVSKSFEQKIKGSIKRKVQTLTDLELQLLIRNNFFVNDDSYRYGIEDENSLGREFRFGAVSACKEFNLGKAKVPSPSPGQRLPYFVKSRRNRVFYCYTVVTISRNRITIIRNT